MFLKGKGRLGNFTSQIPMSNLGGREHAKVRFFPTVNGVVLKEEIHYIKNKWFINNVRLTMGNMTNFVSPKI